MIDEKFGHVLQAAHAPSCMLKGPHLRYSSVFSILDSVCKDPYVAVAGITQQIKVCVFPSFEITHYLLFANVCHL